MVIAMAGARVEWSSSRGRAGIAKLNSELELRS
jgi:hypothetical protein